MRAAVDATGDRLDRLLHRTVLPFWRPILAAPDGGFRVWHDGEGRPLPDRPFGLVVQARLVWCAAHLARAGIDAEFHAAAAERGAAFLLDRFADPDHGGFVWSLAGDGHSIAEAGKHLYGQAFALLALVEAAQLLKDPRIAGAAERLWTTIAERHHDDAHGGYREWRTRDWRPAGADGMSPLGVPARLKLANTHMHMMDAARAYLDWRGDQRAQRALVELVGILLVTVRRGPAQVPTDRFGRDWRAAPDPPAPFSYGHAIELAWLLPRAAATAGMAPALLREHCRRLAATVLRFGADHDEGGLFEAGPLAGPASDRTKSWWVQAEALAGCLDRFLAGGDEAFARHYLHTLEWIEQRQVDPVAGEWHRAIDPAGRPRGNKADHWKCPFHQVRALLHCRRLLAAEIPPRPDAG